jgi:hypothetical protein
MVASRRQPHVGPPVETRREESAMSLRIRTTAVLTGLLLSALAAAPALAAYIDPPGRVARVSYLDGEVSFSPAGEDEWVRAILNRPLIRGDRLWADRRSRVELQLGAAALRLDQLTSAEILDLDDDYAQFFLAEGSVNLYVRRIWEGQVYEIATPTLAVVIRSPGSYRIDVDRNGRHTDVTVWNGNAEAFGERARFSLREGETVRFFDSGLRDFRILGAPRADNFDRFAFDRDRLMDSSPSLRYVSDDLIGYTELDRYGSWTTVREYGAVWFPSRVSSGWAPYRYGHWAWIEPFGWTWIDDMPWGFAVSHYGRWVYVGNRWGWIPAQRTYRAVYAPALVVFVGGSNWSLSYASGVRPIGWFPLGPRDVWFPSYRVSSSYFTRVNVHNTVINNVTVVNVYNNYYVRGGNLSQVNFRYRQTASAHTVVSQDAFTRGRQVQQALLVGGRDHSARAEIQRLAPVAPTAQSLKGAAPAARSTPAREAFQRPVVTSRAPSTASTGIAPFRARQEALARQPGEPLAVQPRAAQAPAGAAQRPLRVVGQDAAPIDRQTPSRGRDEGRPVQRDDASHARAIPERGRSESSTPAPAPRAAPDRSRTPPPRFEASEPATRAAGEAPRAGRVAPVQQPQRQTPATVEPRSVQPAARPAAPQPRQDAPAAQRIESGPQRQAVPAPRRIESAPQRIEPAPQRIEPAPRSLAPAPASRSPETAPRTVIPRSAPAPQATPTQPAFQRAPQPDRARQAEIQRQSVERARQSQQQAPQLMQAPPPQRAEQARQPAPQAVQPRQQQAPEAQPAPQERAQPRQRGRGRDDGSL